MLASIVQVMSMFVHIPVYGTTLNNSYLSFGLTGRLNWAKQRIPKSQMPK